MVDEPLIRLRSGFYRKVLFHWHSDGNEKDPQMHIVCKPLELAMQSTLVTNRGSDLNADWNLL